MGPSLARNSAALVVLLGLALPLTLPGCGESAPAVQPAIPLAPASGSGSASGSAGGAEPTPPNDVEFDEDERASNTVTATASTTVKLGGQPAGVPDQLTPSAVPADAEVVSEKWYARFESGQKNGWLHVRWTKSAFAGQETIHDRTETYVLSTRFMGSVQDTFEVSRVLDLERTPAGKLLYERSETREGGRITSDVLRWTGSGYELESKGAGAKEVRTVACEEPVFIDAEAYLGTMIRAKEVEVGQQYKFQRVYMRGSTLQTVNLEVEGSELLSFPTGPAECWIVRETVMRTPIDVRYWMDHEGVIRQLTDNSRRLVHTTEQRAREMPRGGVSYSITVSAEPELPRCTSFDACEVDVVLAPSEHIPLPDFPETPFSRELSREGNTIRVRLTSHDDLGADIALPVNDPAVASWLKSTVLYAPEHASVRAAVQRALGPDAPTQGREVARRLLEYVFVTLDKRSGPVAQPNAVEILRDGCGDCSEHAVLFVALCRAAGLPARQLSGYAQVGDQWGAHAFCQIWLGKWVGADPTTNELGTAARYIAFGWPEEPDSYPGAVSERIRGRMRIITRTFTDGGETVDLSQRSESNPLRQDRSGLIATDPPSQWNVRFGPMTGMGSITGPGVRCTVSVHAGMGHIPVHLIGRYMLRGEGATIDIGGQAALMQEFEQRGKTSLRIAVPFRRRTMMLDVRLNADTDREEALATIGKILQPTLFPGAAPAEK